MSFTALPQSDDVKQEDGYNAARASYVTAPPSGVLSVHVKSLKLDENQFLVPEPEFYIRVRVGSVTKSTKTVCPNRGKISTVINDVKNFSLTLSTDRSVSQNQVRLDLIMVMTSHVHRILGHKDMHIYDIIKNLYAAGTYDLRFRQQHVAYVELEMCFAYGIFGFGYSHQLRTVKLKRLISSATRCYTVTIHRNQGNTLKEAADLDPFEDLDKEEPVLLMKKMKKRLDQIQSDYSQLGDRTLRKKFLEKLILRKADDQPTELAAGDLPSDGQSSGQHGPGALKGSNKGAGQHNLPNADFVTVDQTDAEYEEGELNVADMTSILAIAPGIVGRINLRDNRPSYLASLDEYSDASGSDSTLGATADSSQPDVIDVADGRPHSNMADMPSTILNRFSNRLRVWRERGASVAPADQSPVGVAARDQTETGGTSVSESSQYHHHHSQKPSTMSGLTGRMVTPRGNYEIARYQPSTAGSQKQKN